MVQGFIVSDLEKKHGAAFYKDIPLKVASGEIKYTEYKKDGIEKAGEVLLDVLTGKNTGKAFLHVADE